MLNKTIVLLMALGALGCAPRETVTVDADVSQEDLAPYQAPGTASVTGQGFMRQRGGTVVTCAGEDVYLVPDLPPIRNAIQALAGGHEVELAGARRWGPAAHRSQCDAQGNFAFENLPAATWQVLTTVSWEVDRRPQGGGLARVVTTTEGEVTNVLLTDADVVTAY